MLKGVSGLTEYREAAKIFKALGDENRVHILKILSSGEKCACHLLEELNITQSTLSHHMKILCDAGLIISHKDGKWMRYRICCKNVQKIRDMMRFLLSPEYIPAYCLENGGSDLRSDYQ